jgi:hypothetical protein
LKDESCAKPCSTNLEHIIFMGLLFFSNSLGIDFIEKGLTVRGAIK